MVHKSLLAAFVAVALLAFGGSSYAWKPEIGSPVEAVTKFEFLDGSAIDPNAFRGRPVMFYFGGEWCAPCQKVRPVVNAVFEKYRQQGLQFVFFSADDNKLRDQKKEEEVARGYRVAMPLLSSCPPKSCVPGNDRDLGAFGRIYVYPTLYMLDKDGILRAKLENRFSIEQSLEGIVAELIKAP